MNSRIPLTRRALAALLILMTVAVYLPAIGAGYIWDDDTLLTANPQMRSLGGLAQIWSGENSRDYTPLTLSSFWLEWRLWGATPTGYHLVSILLHALCALLLWQILERLRVPGAWLGALLFAIHPVNVASVAWVAELKNTLSAALFFGSLLCFLAARDEKRRAPYCASVALFILAALSKGAVVTLPAVLALCILWTDRRLTRRDILQIVPFAAIAVAAAMLTIRFQARAQHYGLIPDSLNYRIARAGADIWFYLGSLIWPAGMSPMRAPWLPDLHSSLAFFPALGAAAMFALFFMNRRTWGRPLLFAYSYFLIMLLPVLGFVWMALMQETPAADWWQYMATPGIFACAAAGIISVSRKWRVTMPLLGAALALLSIQTWRRAAIYNSMETYCRAVTAENPHAWTLENNLGIVLKHQGRFAGAEACYSQALQDNPRYVEAIINMGNAFAAGGNLPAAEWELNAANQMRPGDPEIIRNLASIHFQSAESQAAKGQFAGAEASFRKALTLDPASIPLRIELCRVLIAQHKKQDALKVCAEVDQLAQQSSDPNATAAAAKLRAACEAAPY